MKQKLAIVLWMYNVELWPYFWQKISLTKDLAHLYIGLCEENNNDKILKDLESYPNHTVSTFPNLGLDVLPFIKQIDKIDSHAHPLFLKIHSKKSAWGHMGHVPWGYLLVDSFMGTGNDNTLSKNIDCITKNDSIGMLCPAPFILAGREHTNSAKIEEICNIIGINYNYVKFSDFPAGNMFMSNTALFQKYLSPHTQQLVNLLESEPGRIKDEHIGRYAHSLERIFGYIVKHNGQVISRTLNPKMILYNKLAPNNKFHLCIISNSQCYLEEDANVYGIIIQSDKKYLTIQWMHLPHRPTQVYTRLGNNSLVKTE